MIDFRLCSGPGRGTAATPCRGKGTSGSQGLQAPCKVIILWADGETQGPACEAPNQRRTEQEWTGQVWMLWVCWTQTWSPCLPSSESNLWTLWEGRISGRELLGEESRTQTQMDGRTQRRRSLVSKRATHLIKKRDVVIRSCDLKMFTSCFILTFVFLF